MAWADSFNLTMDTKATWWSQLSHQIAGDVHVPTGSNTHSGLIQKGKPTGHSSMGNSVAASESCNFPVTSANICWKPTLQPQCPAAACQ